MKRRRGYVLIVTLGLLILSAVLLVSIGRAAIDHALRARRAQAELQQRWAAISARYAILPQADDTLTRLEQDLNRPLPVYRTTIRLSGEQLDLILSDEQAKANVNLLISTAGRSSAENRIRTALSGSGLTSNVRLRPASLPPNSDSGSLPRWIEGFGQIFESVGPQRIVRNEGCPAENLTCWGNGGLNVMRAPRAALRLIGSPALNDLSIERLMKARDAAYAPIDAARRELFPSMSDPTPIPRTGDAVTALMARARIDTKLRGQLPLVSRSTCHSLWVIPRRTGATRCYLFVADQSAPGDRAILAFEW